MKIISKIINKTSHKLIIISCFLVVFICLITINFFNNQFLGFLRLDLTHNRIFTLSKGTKKVLTKIDEPITLKLFFSRQLAKDNPFFLSFANRVEEFLKLYQRYSKGKIKLQIIDPLPFTEYEDQAVFYGLQGAPINNDGTDLYFGLVGMNSTVGKEIIPFLQPSREGYLEYDITQLIHKLSNSKINNIGIISDLPIQGDNNIELITNKVRPWLIWQQMQQQFELKLLTEEQIEKIPEDVKVLFLINSSGELQLKTAKAIDQFVINGGHILMCLDPLSEIRPNQEPSPSETKDNKITKVNITKLLEAWGVDYDPNKVVASRSLAKHVRYSFEGKDNVGLYPLWLDVDERSFDKDDVTTANLTKLTFATAGSIAPDSKSKNKFSPLVKIKDTMLVDKSNVTKYKNNPLILLKEYKPNDQAAVLAARITGEVKSAFTAKNVQANIVIIANADFLYDHFWASSQSFLGNPIIIPNSGNATFILNILDNLTGSDELISIRNKDSYINGFDKIRELELNSQNKFQEAENALLKRIADTKQKLSSMEQNHLSVAHKLEEEKFRNDLIDTRKKLREVRRSLREDIQSLENRIKIYTILLIPSIMLLFFIVYSLTGVKLPTKLRYKRYD